MNYNEMIYAASMGETCFRLSYPSDHVYRDGDTMMRNRKTRYSFGFTSTPFVPSLDEMLALDWETKHEDETHIRLEVNTFHCHYIPECLKQPHERVFQ